MRRATGGTPGWLRRLWPRPGTERGPSPGTEVLRPLPEMLGALEALVCDAVVHRPGHALGAARRRTLERLPPARNAFGRPVREEVGVGADGSLGLATGMALAGLRTTVFLDGAELPGVHEDLCGAARRLVPLVVHVANGGDGHAGYHQVSDSGAFMLLPSSAQEAIDLALVSRWLSERALLPGVLAVDGLPIERFLVPDEATVRDFLGEPTDPVPSPTEAQRLLFGTHRSRLLPWFDPARPVATAGPRSPLDEARVRLGRRTFFAAHVAELARDGMESLSRITGRPLGFVNPHRLDDAKVVLVAQGCVARTARAVADHVRQARGWKVGVLGITWLRPFPLDEVGRLLQGRRGVAVIEALEPGTSTDPPLARELRSVLGGGTDRVVATCAGDGPDPARLAGLCELLQSGSPPPRVHLERVPLPRSTGFPRRDALLQALGNSYPQLLQPEVPLAKTVPAEPPGGRSIGLVAAEAALPSDALVRLAETLAEEVGPFVRGDARRTGSGLQARLSAAPSAFRDTGLRSEVSLLFVTGGPFGRVREELPEVSGGGTVLVTDPDGGQRIRDVLPASWIQQARERQLELRVVEGGFDAGLEALRLLLRGEDAGAPESGIPPRVEWPESPAHSKERSLPRVVRRISRIRPNHDSLPRFWGEVAHPRGEGSRDGVADPLTTSGSVPAGASGLAPEPAASMLPVLDPERCTGCGRCWTACPDSAIGVTALPTESLLTAASRIAGTEGRAADGVRRAHRHLAGRLAGSLTDGARELTAEACHAAWEWASERMNLAEEREEHDEAFAATAEATSLLRPVATRPFFDEAESGKKGSGELLVMAVDPRACLGCGLCVAVCSDGALEAADRTSERVAEFERRWGAWEELPDTPGTTLARMAEHAEVGMLPSLLLSRHCAQAQLGGGGSAEPASGERLAARLVTSVVEHRAQQRTAKLAADLEKQREDLEARIRAALSEGLSSTDSDTLSEALAGVTHGRATLAELGRKLEDLGAPPSFDRRAVLRMSRIVGEIERSRVRLLEGEDGLGRARFGVVVARGTVSDWAAAYPHHPYYAPLTVAEPSRAVDLARGVAAGLASGHLELIRLLRRAALEAESPPDRPARLEAIEALRWGDLANEERASCAPVLLVGDDSALLDHGPAALGRLLESDLPVKVLLLDSCSRLGPRPEPALVAMAHRRAFVLSTSVAHPDHLARGTRDALVWAGPALIHVHAPSPSRHGFDPRAMLERARLAVEARAHVLLRYDPGAEGLFGLRATLEGNPAPDGDQGEIGFAEWAAGEERFGAHFEPFDASDGLPLSEWMALPEERRAGRVPVVEAEGRTLAVGDPITRAQARRLEVWHVLRELTGAAGPFTDRIRSALTRELDREHQDRVGGLKDEYEQRIAALRSSADREAVTRLMERLMALAGYPQKPGPRGSP